MVEEEEEEEEAALEMREFLATFKATRPAKLQDTCLALPLAWDLSSFVFRLGATLR